MLNNYSIEYMLDMYQLGKVTQEQFTRWYRHSLKQAFEWGQSNESLANTIDYKN